MRAGAGGGAVIGGEQEKVRRFGFEKKVDHLDLTNGRKDYPHVGEPGRFTRDNNWPLLELPEAPHRDSRDKLSSGREIRKWPIPPYYKKYLEEKAKTEGGPVIPPEWVRIMMGPVGII